MTKKYFVELNHSVYNDYIDGNIMYIEKRHFQFLNENVVDDIIVFLDNNGLYLNFDMVQNFIEKNKLQEYFNSWDEVVEYEDIFDVLMTLTNIGELENFLNSIGLQTGTVGYSPWASYISVNGVNKNYINDYYNGCNFYDIKMYDENSKFLDSYNNAWIENIYELEDGLWECFRIKASEVVIINNEISKMWDAHFIYPIADKEIKVKFIER